MPAAKAAKPASPSLAQLADELGALEKEYALALAPLEMKLPRIKALKEALQKACSVKATDEWIVEGAHFGVRLGPCAIARSIDYKGLIKRIGAAAFAKFATCTLGALELVVTPEIAAAVVSSAQTGPRKLSTFEKGAV
ncbi:MAG: hypothetical protein V4502_07955 [Pseudomonadota bacterium]